MQAKRCQECSHHQCCAGSGMAINSSSNLAAAKDGVREHTSPAVVKDYTIKLSCVDKGMNYPVCMLTQVNSGSRVLIICHPGLLACSHAVTCRSSSLSDWIKKSLPVNKYGCGAASWAQMLEWKNQVCAISPSRVCWVLHGHSPSGTSLSLMCCR